MKAQTDHTRATPDLPALRRLPTPLTYFRIMLRELGTTSTRRARLLRGTGVTEAQLDDPAAEITLGQQLEQFRNADRMGEPGWSLDVGRRFDLGAQGSLGFAMITAPMLRMGFDVLARYGHVRSPWFRLTVERDAHHWGLVVHRQIRLGATVDVALLEAVMLSAQALVEAVLGRPMRGARIACDYPSPDWAHRYRDAFNGVVSFNAKVPSIRMPVAWLALRSPLADAALHNLVVGHLESERRRLESGNHLEARVEVLLAAAGDAGLSLPQLAERLNLSRRTLVRRLNGAGTSFGKLIDRHQMRRAEALLRDPEFSASEVAYRLGYSDPANFTRAFKRWFDDTPGAYRERLRGAPGSRAR